MPKRVPSRVPFKGCFKGSIGLKGPCTQIAYTSALCSPDIVTLGPMYIQFGYMDP